MLLLAITPPSTACELAPSESVTIRRIAEGGDIILSDGRLLTLEGIDWPGRAEPARRERILARLRALTLTMPTHALISTEKDRWNRTPAHLSILTGSEPVWVQRQLLLEGLTFAWAGAAVPRCWPDLLQAEQAARGAGRGLWAHPLFGADGLEPPGLSNRIVYEGRVRSVRNGRRVTFVNFHGPRETTPSWLLTRTQLDAFRKAGRDPATIIGKRLRLRATVEPGQKRRLAVGAPHMVEVVD